MTPDPTPPVGATLEDELRIRLATADRVIRRLRADLNAANAALAARTTGRAVWESDGAEGSIIDEPTEALPC